MSKRPRTERRALARKLNKIVRDKDKLSRFAPGGSPEGAIEVVSPSQVESHARSLPCPLCDASVRVEEHAAETIGESRLRVARVVCTQCGSRRPIYFRIAAVN